MGKPIRKATLALASSAVLAAYAAAPARAEAPPGFRVVDRIKGPDGKWDYASFDPARRRLYVAHGDAVMMVEPDTGKVSPAFAKGSHLHAAFALPGGDVLVTTNGDRDTASLIDAATGAVLADVPTGTGPDAAIFDAASGLILVMASKAGEVTLIEPKSRKAVGSIPVGGALEFAAVDGGGRAFVNVEDRSQIAVIDLAGRKVVARYDLKGCADPSGLAYVAGGLLISACANGVAKVVDAKTGAIAATLSIGPRPDAVIYDAKRRLAFIPSGGDGTLAVIAVGGAAPASVLERGPTQTGARTGAVDPETGRVYLPTAGYKPSPTTGARPLMTPGTFEILVLAPK